jgi:hypothetical protein
MVVARGLAGATNDDAGLVKTARQRMAASGQTAIGETAPAGCAPVGRRGERRLILARRIARRDGATRPNPRRSFHCPTVAGGVARRLRAAVFGPPRLPRRHARGARRGNRGLDLPHETTLQFDGAAKRRPATLRDQVRTAAAAPAAAATAAP